MELRELRLIVSRYLPVAFVVFALCVAAGAAAAYLSDKTYRTSAIITLDVNNDPESGGGSVQQASFLIPALEEKAKSRSLRDRVADDVDESFRQVRVRIETVSDTSILRIKGTSGDPVAAAAWVNAIANRLVEEQADNSPVVLGVLDSAPVKRRPISPNTEPIMLAAIVVGLIAALFSTLAADRMKKAFDNNQAVRDRLDTTVLGEVPVLRRRTERRRPIITLLDGSHESRLLVNAFETIRTNVEFRMAQAKATEITVVSLTADSGVSTITAGLSYTLAAVGRPVVAVEADLRRPNLAEELDVKPRDGLGDLAAFGPDPLTDNEHFVTTVREITVQQTSNPRLSIVPAGIPVGRPADVVTRIFPSLLDVLRSDGKTLLVDSPPLQSAPESSLIVSAARHVVLVVNNNSSDFSNLTEAIDRINRAGGSVLGVIINRVPRRRIRGQHDTRDKRRSQPYVRQSRDEPEPVGVGDGAGSNGDDS